MVHTGAKRTNTRQWFPDAYLATRLSLQSDLGSNHGCWHASNEPEPTPITC